MKGLNEYPTEKQTQAQAQMIKSGRRVILSILSLICFLTGLIMLDDKTGYPFHKAPSFGQIVSFDPVKWFKYEFPIIVDDALMRYEMARIDLDSTSQVCPQEPPFRPSDSQLKIDIPSEDLLAERLSKAIQVDTSVGDNWPSPSEAPDLWTPVFDPFKRYLEYTFPKCHEVDGKISREIVNQHGLLYTFKGSDESLKPLLFMAHQDVVPVNPAVESEWWYPPFSGHISKENGTIWGRGSTDAKLWLVSVMSSFESLLESGFQPKRTVIASWGFDEEASGVHGAASLAKRLEEIYGRDSIAMIVDEGNPVVSKSNPFGYGIPLALPAVEEKGMLNVKIRVESEGGHSSAPPLHSSIGLLSRLVVELENHPDHPQIDLDSAQLKFLQCIRNAPTIPIKLRGALKDLDWASRADSRTSLPFFSSFFSDERRRRQRIDRAKKRVVEFLGPELSVAFVTTRAVDIFHGGVKSNAIPEQAEAVVNHRIATHSSVSELKKEYIYELKWLAEKLNLQFFAWGEEIKEHNSIRSHSVIYDKHGRAHHVSPSNKQRDIPFVGKVFLEEFSQPLEPAPKTPISSDPEDEDSKAWRLFSSVIRNVWRVDQNGEPIQNDEHQDQDDGEENGSGSGVLTVPSLMQGNTDTQRYWGFTKNIFRFGPSSLREDGSGLGAFRGVHTTNEHCLIDSLTQSVRFYTQLIQAVDDSDL